LSDDGNAFGRKIARARERLGWTQRELGARLQKRSEAWVSQVERGVLKVERIPMIKRLAEVLDIPLAELMPDRDAVSEPAERGQIVSDLTTALMQCGVLGGSLGGAQPVGQPTLDVNTLAAEAAQAWEHVHNSEYSKLAGLLQDVLPALEQAARTVGAKRNRHLHTTLAKAYHAAAAVLSKLGEHAAAWVAADRAIRAAQQSGDPLLVGAGMFRLTLVFQSARWAEHAKAVATAGDEALSTIDSSALPGATSVRGALNLQLAIIAARTEDHDQAHAHLDIARELAAELKGEDRNDYDTEFGPTNVQVHEVAVALELGDAGHAVRVGEKIDASGMSIERRARLRIDLARAHAQRRNHAKVLDALVAAEALAPEQARNHPIVAGLIAELDETAAADDPAFLSLKDRLNF